MQRLVDLSFFHGALPEAVFWGHLALWTGITGLALSGLILLAYTRDRVALRRAASAPVEFRPPLGGPLRSALGAFFSDPLNYAPMSADSASEYVAARLDAHRDLVHSILRFFAYTPLLLGLMGTTLALRGLLVVGGNTLQEIQPQLSGVFAGTLAGISGSLLAAIGALAVDRTALSSNNRAQDFVHRYILPMLPERRISIRIEEAVLTAIGERAQAVAEQFRRTLEPSAQSLELLAERCGVAAAAATKAFLEASNALTNAGDLEAALRQFKSGAHMIDSAAEQLSDATKQTAEVVLRTGEIRTSLIGVFEQIRDTSEHLGTASERVSTQLGAQIEALRDPTVRAETALQLLCSNVQDLSKMLAERGNADSIEVQAVRTYAEMLRGALAGVADTLATTAKETDEIMAALSLTPSSTASLVGDATTAAVELAIRNAIAGYTATNQPHPPDGKAPIPASDGALAAAIADIKAAARELRAPSEPSRKPPPVNSEVPPKRGLFGRLWN